MIAVSRVAEAIANAIERGRSGEIYQVGDENVSWRDFFGRLSKLLGKAKDIHRIPKPLVRLSLYAFQVFCASQGKSGGFTYSRLADLLTSYSFIDPTPSRLALGYAQGGLEQALAETARAALAP
jgi:dihydroflavonol-4-reductase